jgi:homoserine kinase
MTVRVDVPATSANLGAGFDAVGLALDLWNSVDFQHRTQGLEITCEGEGARELPRDTGNLVHQAFVRTCRELGQPPPPVSLHITARVPLGSGLGSSATAIVAGVVGACRLLQADWTPEQMLDCATRLDGHPDNVAPALLGGVVVAAVEDGHARVLRFLPPATLTCVVATPRMTVSTAESRAQLPASVSREDAVFNLARSELLVGALLQERYDLLGTATQDRLHQDVRLAGIPGAAQALRAARQAGAAAAALSGSGPTVIALIDRRVGRTAAVVAALEESFAQAGLAAFVREVAPSLRGALGTLPDPSV